MSDCQIVKSNSHVITFHFNYAVLIAVWKGSAMITSKLSAKETEETLKECSSKHVPDFEALANPHIKFWLHLPGFKDFQNTLKIFVSYSRLFNLLLPVIIEIHFIFGAWGHLMNLVSCFLLQLNVYNYMYMQTTWTSTCKKWGGGEMTMQICLIVLPICLPFRNLKTSHQIPLQAVQQDLKQREIVSR